MKATPFDADAMIGGRRLVIRDGADGLEAVELAWGLQPRSWGDRPFRFIRSEGRTFPTHRCLIPASEFHVTASKRRYKFALEDGNWFYLAGIWRPAADGWPEAYAILTVEANPEVSRYQARQGAVLLRRQRMEWLDATLPEAALLQPLAARSFNVVELSRSATEQRAMAL